VFILNLFHSQRHLFEYCIYSRAFSQTKYSLFCTKYSSKYLNQNRLINGDDDVPANTTSMAGTSQEATTTSGQPGTSKPAEVTATSEANAVDILSVEKPNDVKVEAVEKTCDKGKERERVEENKIDGNRSENEDRVVKQKHYSKRTEEENVLLARGATLAVSNLFITLHFFNKSFHFCKSIVLLL
jgi:hypothetical protein